MNASRRYPLVPLLAACLWMSTPASAGELGLLYSKQYGQAQAVAGAGSYDKVDTATVGFRGSWSVLDLKVAELSLSGTYQPKAKQDFYFNGAKLGQYGVGYGALGAQMDWKLLVNLNVGVEMRRETLSWDLGAGGQSDSTLTRPWARAGIGFSLPTPVVSPFLRLEVAFPLSREDGTGSPDAIRKAMAPQSQVGIYAGIRF